MPDGAEVDPQLVRSSRLEATLDEGHGGCVVLPADFVGGARRPALVADRHAGAPRRRPADRRIDDPARRVEAAPDQREVTAIDVPSGERGDEHVVRPRRPGDQHEPARVAIEAVHDAGPGGVADVGELREPLQ